MFPHSNLPNCILSSDFFVNEIAFLLLPFRRMCHIAERHACPSKSLSCLLDPYQHFVEKEGGLSTAIWNIAVVWLASVLLGEMGKMDSWCGQSNELNVDYFCVSVWFKVCYWDSISKKRIIETLNLWGWWRKTWGRAAERCISFHHFRKARGTQI